MKKIVSFPFLFFIYCFIYLAHLKISIIKNTDDSWFADQPKHTPYVKWIISRYQSWSGRLFPDTMLYALLNHYVWLWRIISALLFLLLSLYIIKTVKKDVTRRELFLSIFILGYISWNVLNAGFFWITGSINYLWPISLGLIAMYPFANQIFEYKLKISPLKNILFLIAGIIATISNEQVALCMSAFSFLSIINLIIKRKQWSISLILLTIFFMAGTSVLLFAPGNKVRWVSEVNHWYPGFDHLTIIDKVHLGIIWLYQQLFLELRNLVIILSILLFAIYIKTNTKKIAFYLFSFFLFLAISSVFLGNTADLFYNFQLINQYHFSQNLLHFWKSNWAFVHAVFPYMFWTIYSILLMYLILVQTKHKFFVFLCIAAALSTFIMLFFSPTIYASGPRTLTVGSVLLSIVIVKLVLEFELIKNNLCFVLLGCLPFLNLLQIIISK